MKRFFYLSLIISLFILLISCEAEFDPKVDLQEVYILNCIIRCDSSYQIATLSKLYDVNNYDPMSNIVDPSVKFAKIVLTDSSFSGQKEIYQFRDSSVARTNNSRYSTPQNFYYIKNFKLTKPGVLKIEATLPDGRILRSSSFTVPLDKYSVNYFHNDNPKYLSNGSLLFDWSNVKYELDYVKPYFLPEFIIKYSQFESGNWVKYQTKIPLSYTNVNGEEVPIYPEIESINRKISYEPEVIRKTIEMISKNDQDKNNYKIEKVVFMLHVLNNNFATYISLQQHYKSDFSISVIEPNYGNVWGGFGLFGNMHTIQLEVPLNNLIGNK